MPGVFRGEGSSAIPPPRPSSPEVSGAREVRGVSEGCPRGVLWCPSAADQGVQPTGADEGTRLQNGVWAFWW